MDQDLRDLTLQIQDLIRTMRGTSGTGATTPKDTGAEVVRSVDKMVVALAKLAVTLDSSKKTKVAEEEAIKKFTKSVDKTTDELNKEIAERKKLSKSIEDESRLRAEAERDRQKKIDEFTGKVTTSAKDLESRIKSGNLFNASVLRNRDEMAKLAGDLNATGATAGALKGAFGEMAGASTPAQLGLKFLGTVANGAGKSLKEFSTNLLDGRRGPETTAKAFTTLTSSITGFASTVGGAAMALGGIAMLIPGFQGVGIAALAAGAGLKAAAVAGDTFAAYNERAAKQLASTFDVYNRLSQASITVENGINGTTSLIHTLNMTTAEAEKFGELLGSSSKNLALMGGTAGAGAKRFAEVAGALSKSDIGRTFEVMGITADEQREATLQYMSIQARTGQLQLKSTQQLVQESGKFVEELDLAAKITGQSRKAQQEALEANMAESRYRAALFAAEQRGDRAEVARLKKAGDMAGMLRALGLEEQATGTLQFAASGGAPTTPQALNAMMQLGLQEVLNDPNVTAVGALQQSLNYSKEQLSQLAETTRFTGDLGPIMKDIPKTIDAFERISKAQQEASRLGFKSLEDYLKSEQGKAALADPKLKAVVDGNRAQLAAAQIMETGINDFNTAAKIHEAGSKAFAKAVDTFGKAVGLKVAGGIGTFDAGGVAGIDLARNTVLAESRAVQARADLRKLNQDIKDAEEKLRTAKTDVEKSQAGAELEKLNQQLGTAEKKVNAAELGKRAAENRSRLAQAHGRLKAGPVDTELLNALTSTGITDRRAQANVLAQIQAESGGVAKSENLNYSPEQLMQMFPNKFKDIGHARQIAAGGEEAIGEHIYGGRMGNTAPGEGYKYRGRGLVQLTGKNNYKKYGDILGIDLVKNPDLANDPDIARKIAAAYFKEAQKSGVDLTQSKQVSGAVGHVDIGGGESNRRADLANQILDLMPKAAAGGVFKGPLSGYPATLHGTEAVIPLKNGSVPVMMPAIDQMVSATDAVNRQVQTLKDELTGMMREIATALSNNNNNGAQERMIQILENIARSQTQTATASKRLASVAVN